MNGKIIGIQLLRYIAATLVVVMHTTEAISLRVPEHAGKGYWGLGSFGVDIFFVISGYVMALTAPPHTLSLRENLLNSWIFLKRRVARIVPAYWFYTACKIALVVALPSYILRTVISPEHVIASLLFVPVESPWGLIQPVLPVGWTLNFEILFYLIFAVSIALSRDKALIPLVIFVLIYWSAQLYPDSIIANFYSRTIIFEFIFGVLIFLLSQRIPVMPASVSISLVTIGIALAFFSEKPADGEHLFWFGVPSALIVLGTVYLERILRTQKLLEHVSVLGDISYSIYLVHSFVTPASVILHLRIGIGNPVIVTANTIALVTVCSFVSYRLLEAPVAKALKPYISR